MPLYYAAQILPLHIVQSIVSYVVWSKDVGSDMDKIKITTSNRKDLLIFIKVCHHWRSIVLPLYYYSASISLYDVGISRFRGYKKYAIDLDKVTENKSQHHIQRLYFTIWNSALVQPKAAIKALRKTVKQCGQLKRARAVILKFECDWFNQPSNSSNREDVAIVDDLERICTKYASLFDELLPNRCKLVFQSFNYYGSNFDFWRTIHTQMCNFFHIILGENITSFESSGLFISEELVDGLKNARLQHLSVGYHHNSSAYINLIRQNSASLESLYLGNSSKGNISMLIFPPGDSGVLTYPRLKKLDMCRYGREDVTACEQLESDPCPALEEFICEGSLSHGALAILKIGNSHIRKLDLAISREVLDAMERNNIFTAGSYSALASMYIRLYDFNSHFDSEKASRFIAMLLNLSPTTRHVHLDYFDFYFNDAVLPDIVQSDSLKTLNLGKIGFTMDQIVKLVSKFKNLDRLTITLMDYPNGGSEAPDNDELRWWKDELKAYTSNIRNMCIKRTRFHNSIRVVEYIVLIASILEGVGKITFTSYGSGDNLNSPLKNIRSVLKRPVYKKCEYMHSVKFCIDNSL